MAYGPLSQINWLIDLYVYVWYLLCNENSGTGRKTKKKRKLIIDEQKLIPSDTMRAQLRRAADLVIPLELAPPTKKLMEWKHVGSADRLLIMSGKHIGPARLQKVVMN